MFFEQYTKFLALEFSKFYLNQVSFFPKKLINQLKLFLLNVLFDVFKFKYLNHKKYDYIINPQSNQIDQAQNTSVSSTSDPMSDISLILLTKEILPF